MKSLSEKALLTRIRAWTLFFIAALFVSGLTAIPLEPELDLLVKIFAQDQPPTVLGEWLLQVQTALHDVGTRWPFLGLGMDWLAFGHVVIGLGFIGLLRDPVRNEWLITWGWRLIDCSFGIGGMVPMLIIRAYVQELKLRREAGVSL